MADDRREEQRRADEESRARLEVRRQEEDRERRHRQRTLCTSCGLIVATMGQYCAMCVPDRDHAEPSAAWGDPGTSPDVWEDDDDRPDVREDGRDRAVSADDRATDRWEETGAREPPADAVELMTSTYSAALERALDAGAPIDKHHVFPVHYADRFERLVEDDGSPFDIDALTVPLPQEWHRQLTDAWDKEWGWFFDSHVQPTLAQVQEQAARMMEDYELLEAILVRSRRHRRKPSDE